MSKRHVSLIGLLIMLLGAPVALVSLTDQALAFERTPQKPAIVLAAFGTTEVGALGSILNIRDRVAAAFPNHDIHLAFTSNIIRNIWHERDSDAAFKKSNPKIPQEIYSIKNALTVLASIQEEGARLVLVQSLHVADGEEYRDLESLVNALAKYDTVKPVLKPFPWIGIGEPALGLKDGQSQYLDRAVAALAPLAEKAKTAGAALVLMGHGNEHLTQKVYSRLEAALRKAYGPQIYIGTVESPPHAPEILAALKASADAPGKVFLAPLMVVAGDHAINDMAGEEDDSWASIFKAGGLTVETYLEGLGSNNSWADIYIEHLKVLAPMVEAKQAADNK
ncbi:MAG: sirohydrochlorin cobaltochelatase [Deltaproteobacteria bacterium]|jgi:sirohydrochlorin cobaltochelatase|nr:sirohydrochlorin cobaltochelatase [Deltaproteobacteria bacterium]